MTKAEQIMEMLKKRLEQAEKYSDGIMSESEATAAFATVHELEEVISEVEKIMQ